MALRRFAGLLLLVACAVQAQPVPPLTGRVVDRGEVLTASTEQALTDLLAEHEATTSNQIVVLTVTSLDGYSVEDYAERVFNEWGLGQEEQDNGVLVLIARDDREMRIEVGYGLEDPLTDSRAGRIIRGEFVPSFRSGNYDAGALAGVAAILGVIEGTYEPPDTGGGGGASDVPVFMRLMFGLMFCLMPLLAFVPSFLVAGQPGGLVFAGIFIVVGAGVVTVSLKGALLVLVIYVIALLLAEAWLRKQEGIAEARAEIRKALEENAGRRVKVTLGGMTMTLGGITQGGGSGGSSGGGFSSGGGGFSGGGGSSGGGGASGSW